MTSPAFSALFDGPPRELGGPITDREKNLAASVQVVTEEILLRCVRHVHAETGMKNLCLAGGVALNCVANGRVLREGPFEQVWIQPASGDAGGALGVALLIWHQLLKNPRQAQAADAQHGSRLGSAYDDAEIGATLERLGARAERLPDDEALCDRVAALLDAGQVVGWFQGRMEFGPRALGGRSIIGDPRSRSMQSVMNLKIKYRESFRPFAPSVLAEKVSEWFEIEHESPYMLLVADVTKVKQIAMTDDERKLFGIEKLNVPRSEIPAITHVDYSARIQTVHEQTNPRYHRLLQAFEQRTGCPVLVNTSFNVRGEPIVCTPEDAYRCFMRTEMDYLVLENYVLAKPDQPEWADDGSWKDEFELD